METFVLDLRSPSDRLPEFARTPAADRRTHAGSAGLEGDQPSTSLFDAPVAPGHRGDQHAQQDQPPGAAVRATGRRRNAKRRCHDASEKYIAFKTMLIKEVLRFARIWMQTIVPPMITTALYFVIFGRLIGPQIGHMAGVALHRLHRARPDHDGGDHQLLRQRGVVVLRLKFQRHIEEMLVSPVPNYLILPGFVVRRRGARPGGRHGRHRWCRCSSASCTCTASP